MSRPPLALCSFRASGLPDAATWAASGRDSSGAAASRHRRHPTGDTWRRRWLRGAPNRSTAGAHPGWFVRRPRARGEVAKLGGLHEPVPVARRPPSGEGELPLCVEGRIPRDDWRDVRQGILGASAMAIAFFTRFMRSRRRRWGLRADTASRPLPGDELVAEPRWGSPGLLSTGLRRRRLAPHGLWASPGSG